MAFASIVLKKERHFSLLKRHPWIFSGAIEKWPTQFADGEILAVLSYEKKHLGYGFFRRDGSLCGRMISFCEKDPYQSLKEHIQSAVLLRRTFFNNSTTAYRLINAEGDGMPGLVVDYYAGYLVIQISTMGMERIKKWLVDQLQEIVTPLGVYEKSDGRSRHLEKLEPSVGILKGKIPEIIEIHENGIRFLVSVIHGQKTGFFLDQRSMRQQIGRYTEGKSVLNAFGYTGAFSLYALKGGARLVDTVDSSKGALLLARQNCLINGFHLDDAHFIEDDIFHYLKTNEKKYDVIILDPPAFAKHATDLKRAQKAYRDLNRMAMGSLKVAGILFTASCSYHVDENAFLAAVRGAASDLKRSAKLLAGHQLAQDHPISLFHDEGSYLKSFIIIVD